MCSKSGAMYGVKLLSQERCTGVIKIVGHYMGLSHLADAWACMVKTEWALYGVTNFGANSVLKYSV